MPAELLVLPRVLAFCRGERCGFAHRWTARNVMPQFTWIDSGWLIWNFVSITESSAGSLKL
jgi:hypothetical protein